MFKDKSPLFTIICLLSFSCSLEIFSKEKILFVTDKFPWFTRRYFTPMLTILYENGFDLELYTDVLNGYRSNDFLHEKELLRKITVHVKKLPNLNQYDLIICNSCHEARIIAQLKQKLQFKAKIISFARGGDITTFHALSDVNNNTLFSLASLFLPVCEYLKFRLTAAGCNPNLIKVLYSPIDLSKYTYNNYVFGKNKSITLVTVGRLDQEKGFIELIEAVSKIHRDGYNIHLIVIGNGKSLLLLKKLTKTLKLNKIVEFVGWKSPEDIIKILRHADLFILNSITASRGTTEGIANAVKEAMAVGIPVVTTCYAGNFEIITHEKNGFLVPERDIYGMSLMIKSILDNPSILRGITDEARKKIEEMFDLTKIQQQFIEIIQEQLRL